MIVRANFHTHTTWCDGSDSPEAVIQAAIARNFDAIGFSSHAMLPENVLDWVLTPEKALAYAAEIRSLAAKYADRIRVFCGVEAQEDSIGLFEVGMIHFHEFSVDTFYNQRSYSTQTDD